MLNYSILTVAFAIALLITFEDMKAALEIKGSQTARVLRSRRVRETFLALF
jgi:hypothetical protein